jgi:hypothetical protein
MQRVHMDDLTGFVTDGSDEWTVSTFRPSPKRRRALGPATKSWHHRRVGDLLHPEREPLAV